MAAHCIIGVTVGDPTGIGPEIVLKALTMEKWDPTLRFRIYSPHGVLELLSQKHQISLSSLDIEYVDDKEGGAPDLSRARTVRLTLQCIKRAVEDCMAAKLHAMVTAPVHKGSIREYQKSFIGHTELLADLSGSDEPTMFMVGEKLRVGLVTTHVPLRMISKKIKKERVLRTINRVHHALERMGIMRPRIAVCSLNPHGDPHAELDLEEEKEILPALNEACKKYENIEGTVASDVVFRKAYQGHIDGIIAMYHDQALGAFKMVEFDKGVNVTLGLPFIRTSPDHGTAYDIAGRWMADPRSMIYAIRMAVKLSS